MAATRCNAGTLLYELDGTLKGVRKTGSYPSAPGGVHSEGAGDTDCIVIYNIRGNGRDEMFDMLDETVQNVGKIGFEDFAGMSALEVPILSVSARAYCVAIFLS